MGFYRRQCVPDISRNTSPMSPLLPGMCSMRELL
jgi:hypothetical protein